MYGMWNIERNGLYQKWKELKKKEKTNNLYEAERTKKGKEI